MTPISSAQSRISTKKFSPEFENYLAQPDRAQSEETISAALTAILTRAEQAIEFYVRYKNKTNGHAGKNRQKAEANFKDAIRDFKLLISSSRTVINSSLSERRNIQKALQDEVVYLDINKTLSNPREEDDEVFVIDDDENAELVISADVYRRKPKYGRRVLSTYEIRHLKGLNPGIESEYVTKKYISNTYIEEVESLEQLLSEAKEGYTFFDVSQECFGLMVALIQQFNAEVNNS
jgi:hypothetical protein